MALAAGTGYLVNLIYYVSTGTLKMVDEIPVPSLMALTSLMGSTPPSTLGNPNYNQNRYINKLIIVHCYLFTK